MFQLAESEEQKMEMNSTERLTTLHTRLHQEAEKISKWKLQTEIEIKQKVYSYNITNVYAIIM